MRIENLKENSQAMFAAQAFGSLEGLGKQLFGHLEQYKEDRKPIEDAYHELKGDEKNDESKDKFYDDLGQLREELHSKLEILFIGMTIQMTTTLGHALNSKTTDTMKDLINFMDTSGIGDKILIRDIIRISNTRDIRSNNLLDLASVVAAQAGDFEFIKRLEKFAEKNKTRENIFEGMSIAYSYREYSDMSGMTAIVEHERIAFEALISGSKDIYMYYTDGKGLPNDYIGRYIVTNKYWTDRFSQTEVAHVLEIHPELIDDITEKMPENLPQDIIDIFMF